jgi:hypothetical protein
VKCGDYAKPPHRILGKSSVEPALCPTDKAKRLSTEL